ncbi:hypothetical protein ACHAPU_004543 [Fusarium lateritium]
MVHPIIDKYYERDPHHVRSSAFVQAKGLTSNEKNRSDTGSPAVNDRQHDDLDGYRKMIGKLSIGPSRSLSPDVCRQTRTPAPVCESITVPQPQPQLQTQAKQSQPVLQSQSQSQPQPQPQPAQVSPPIDQNNRPAPAQGNIKVKRRSVQLPDSYQGSSDFDQISDTDEPTCADVRNPRKLSRYFPELTLASSARS